MFFDAIHPSLATSNYVARATESTIAKLLDA